MRFLVLKSVTPDSNYRLSKLNVTVTVIFQKFKLMLAICSNIYTIVISLIFLISGTWYSLCDYIS